MKEQTEINSALYLQAGVLPYRRKGDSLEILIITNKKKNKWGIPKGLVDSQYSSSDTAAGEAYEEAGIRGVIRKPYAGKFSIRKWGGKCRIKVFAMEVTEVLDRWPEDMLRFREWHSVQEAAGMVKNKKLKSIILGLPELLK